MRAINIAAALTVIAQLPNAEKSFELAQAFLNMSGPAKFIGESFESPLNHPLLFALTARHTRLIELYHQNGCALKEDDSTAVGIQLGAGFWCMPELIFPSMRTDADLYGFIYQIMDRRKQTPEDMAATVKTIQDFANWADPENLSSRITQAVCVWQAKRGNGFMFFTGSRDYQLQTLAALINIGLDVERPIKQINMNNA